MDAFIHIGLGYEFDSLTAKKVCDELQNKYGKNFVAHKIGDRLNTGRAALFVSPEDEKDFIFTAHIAADTRDVSDDYIISITGKKLENEIRRLITDGTEASYDVKCFVPNQMGYVPSKADYAPVELLQELEIGYFNVNVVTDSKDIIDSFIEVLKKISRIFNVGIIGNIFLLKSADYEKYLKISEGIPHIGLTGIRKCHPVRHTVIVAKDEDYRVREEEIDSYEEGEEE